MIGGGGERKTLRLVAQYADATNVFGGPEQIHHKYEVLREHCEAVGRNFDEIERSNLQTIYLDPRLAAADRRPLRRAVRRGRPAHHLQRRLDRRPEQLETIGREILPHLLKASRGAAPTPPHP